MARPWSTAGSVLKPAISKFMNQNGKLKVVFIELLDSLSNDLAEFLFNRTGCTLLFFFFTLKMN